MIDEAASTHLSKALESDLRKRRNLSEKALKPPYYNLVEDMYARVLFQQLEGIEERIFETAGIKNLLEAAQSGTHPYFKGPIQREGIERICLSDYKSGIHLMPDEVKDTARHWIPSEMWL